MVALGSDVMWWLLGGLWIGVAAGYVLGALMTGSKRADTEMLREENRSRHLRGLGL